MDDSEHRKITRDSLFLMADLRVEGESVEHRVKVRNLSAGGMMAEAAMHVTRGNLVSVNIRNIGWVNGHVAWVQDNRFGIAFMEEIDPKIAREPVTSGEGTPRYVKPPLSWKDPSQRKI